MAHLPGWQDADIPLAKFADYSLNPANPNNRFKWAGFAALGYAVATESGREAGAWDLISQLRRALPLVDATPWRHSTAGDPRWDVRVTVRGPNGKTGTLHTAWQVRPGRPARLITNWLEVHKEAAQ